MGEIWTIPHGVLSVVVIEQLVLHGRLIPVSLLLADFITFYLGCGIFYSNGGDQFKRVPDFGLLISGVEIVFLMS